MIFIECFTEHIHISLGLFSFIQRILRSVTLVLIGVLTVLGVGLVRAEFEQVGSPLAASAPPSGRGYDGQHYTLDLTWDDVSNRLTGMMTLDAVASQGLTTISLDFQEMTVEDVWVNGVQAGFSHANGALTISPDEAIARGQRFTAAVSYQGIPQPVSLGPRARDGWVRTNQGVYVMNATGGASWYPSNNNLLDKATYTLRVTAPHPYEVVAIGALQDIRDDGGRRTFIWETETPIAGVALSLHIGVFDVDSAEGPAGVGLSIYYPQHLNGFAANKLNDTSEIMAYFGGLFGPYPFEAHTTIVNDSLDDISFAARSMTVLGDRVAVERTIAYQLARQWFGNSVTPVNRQDIWLDQGLSMYANLLWAAHSRDFDINPAMRNLHDSVRNLPPPGNPPADDPFNDGTLLRGAWTFHALRLQVGDALFFEIVRQYTTRYQHSNATTADFIALAENLSGRQLEDFFAGWLHAPQAPAIIPELV